LIRLVTSQVTILNEELSSTTTFSLMFKHYIKQHYIISF